MKKSGSIRELPNIYRSPERDCIPIRSVTYRKNLEIVKDCRLNKDFRVSMPGVTPASTKNVSSIPEERAFPDMVKTQESFYKPRFNLQLHKLSVRDKQKSMTTREYPPNPQIYIRPVLPPPPVNKGLKKSLTRNLTSVKDDRYDDQEDYFNLLFDKNRKAFNVYECEGSEEYYTPEMISSRITKQGFRDSDYYSTACKFDLVQVPEEETIKRNYMLKISPWVSSMENKETTATHVLGGTSNNYLYVEYLAQAARDTLEATKQEKKLIVEEMKALEKKFENEFESLMQEFNKKFQELDCFNKDDFITSQADNFKMQKEITLIKRDKLNLENNIAKSLKRVDHLESVLYGRNVFELEASQRNLDNISENNLRKVHSSLMNNSQLIH